MAIVDGLRADAANTNARLLSRTVDTSAVGKIDLENVDTTTINDIQNFMNVIRTYIGQLTDTNIEGDTPDWASLDANANIVGTASDDILDKVVAIILKFLGTGGHSHDGTDGNGPQLDLTAAVSGILPAANGGTGLDGSAAANGQLLIGDGAGYVLATITGTADQVIVTNGAGTITLSLPQDIGTSSSPTFLQATITNSPVAATDVANKAYVDALFAGSKWKQNVRVATTGPGTLASDFEDGDTVDGVTLATGDRILIKDQVDGTENGIYEVQATGAPVRTEDADEFEELNSAVTAVSEGTDNENKSYLQTAELTSFATPQVWVQNGGAGVYSVDGNALQELSPNVFSLVIDGSTLSQSASGLKVADGTFVTISTTESISGDKTFTGLLNVGGDFVLTVTTNAATGADVELADPSTPVIELTGAGLVSIEQLGTTPTAGQTRTLINNSGDTISLLHDSGTTAAAGFFLPEDTDLEIPNHQGVTLVYSGTDSRWMTVGGSGSGGAGGSGSGGINYILNPDAETDTTGWAAYADTAQADPEDGTGGSPTVTITQNTTTPLRGTGDFVITKDAASRQGEGVSYDFTIDKADQARVLRVTYDYEISANFSVDDITMWVYDVTNTRLISVTDNALDGSGRFIGEFQTSADSTSYRLIFHIPTTNALAWTFNFDNVQVGPREIAKDYSPNRILDTKTLSSNVTTNITMSDLTFDNLIVGKTYKFIANISMVAINGDNINVQVFHDGTSIGIASLNAGTGDDVGSAVGISGTFTATTTTLTFVTAGIGGGSSITGNGNRSGTYAQVEELNNYEGNDTVVKSTDFGNRVIVGSFGRNTTQSIPNASNTKIELNDELENSGGLDFDGAGDITILESGYYHIDGLTMVDNIDDGDRQICYIVVNAAVVSRFEAYSANENDFPSATTSVNIFLNAGDVVNLFVFHDNGVARNINADSARVRLDIHKIVSPQTLLGNEVVALSYTSDSGQTLTNNTDTLITFEDLEFDTNSAYSSGVFSAPIAGKYFVQSAIEIDFGADFDLDEFARLKIYKNGASFSQLNNLEAIASPTGYRCHINGSRLVDLQKGETISIYGFQNSGSNKNLGAVTERNYLSIHKVN